MEIADRMADCGTLGVCGLQNLGNTCFMNSALQCLSNCPPLTEYFLSGKWAEDVNETNPLGMGGRLAEAYAGMVRNIWSGNMSSVIPRDFKYTVSKFAPTFSGYHQQDSQELMAFLLDGLHEDLNRVRNKPYVELKDADGRSDEVVAEEAWDDFKMRNDSVITDLLHGQLKSKLICSVCAKVSVTFDPFCFLSLPMPVKKEKQLNLTFVSAWPDFTWTKYKVGVPKQEGTTADIFAALGKLRSLDTARLVLAEVADSRLRKILKITDRIYDLSDRDDLIVYEMSKEEAENPVVVCLYQRYQRSFTSGEMWNLTAQPTIFKLSSEDFTPQNLHDIIQQRARAVFTDLPAEGVEWMEDERSGSGEGNDSGLEENEASSNLSTFMDTEKSFSDETSLYEVRRTNEYGTTASSGVHVPQSGEKAEDILIAVLNSPNYFSIDWHPVAYRKFNTQYNLDVTEHDSVKKVVARKEIDLTDCLRHFEAEEKLGENDLWYCPGCKASKKMGIWRAPRLLVMHLKRFSYTRTLRDKIENLVNFPLKGLDMGPFIMGNSSGEPILYDLLAVSNHMGGLGGGHYTAFGLNKYSNRWYSFDDSCVSSVPEDSVKSESAYALVFMKRSRDTIEASTLEEEWGSAVFPKGRPFPL